MEPRTDWPLGPALKRRREARGLSVRAAAKRTGKEISEGWWRCLESGYRNVGQGQYVPVTTTPETVHAAANAVNWDVSEALETAGFDTQIEIAPPRPAERLADLSDEELVNELLSRLRELRAVTNDAEAPLPDRHWPPNHLRRDDPWVSEHVPRTQQG